jgi:hypothetical protein
MKKVSFLKLIKGNGKERRKSIKRIRIHGIIK